MPSPGRPSRSASSDRSSSRRNYSSSSSSSTPQQSPQQQSSSSSSRRSRSHNSTNGHSHSHSHHHHHSHSSHLLHSPISQMSPHHNHDDSEAGQPVPHLAVDYLGNGWTNEDDIAVSWRIMTKQKRSLVNGIRLENASWRSWAQTRGGLKKVSPKTLNWLKDSDTTWLYGPLYKASIAEYDLQRFGNATIPSPAARPPPTANQESGLKPALKYKTASELFKADTLFHVQSDLKLDRKIEPYSKAQESAVFKEHRQPKLRFNDSVEQCVSVDDEGITDLDEEDGEDHDDDDGILMRISAERKPRSIVRIRPTRLKPEGIVDFDYDGHVSGSYYQSSGSHGQYAGSATSHVGARNGQDSDLDEEDEDAAIAAVSYTRPTAPSTALPYSSSAPSSSTAATSAASVAASAAASAAAAAHFNRAYLEAQSNGNGNGNGIGSSNNSNNKTISRTNSAPSSPVDADEDGGPRGGIGQRAADMVANVRDIVHWASSLVYNSSTF